jgi:putative transposase
MKQDQRFIMKITNPMMGFKTFHPEKATIKGIETAQLNRKGKLSYEKIPAYKIYQDNLACG